MFQVALCEDEKIFAETQEQITDNALEACMSMPEGLERFIRLTVTKRGPYLNIRCVNSKSGDIISADGKVQTNKTGDGHGYGLRTIGRIVDAYDGMMNIEHDENTFTLTLALKDIDVSVENGRGGAENHGRFTVFSAIGQPMVKRNSGK